MDRKTYAALNKKNQRNARETALKKLFIRVS